MRVMQWHHTDTQSSGVNRDVEDFLEEMMSQLPCEGQAERIKGIPGRENKYAQKLKRTLQNLKTQSNAYALKKKKKKKSWVFLEENKTPQLSLKAVDGIIFIFSQRPVENVCNNQPLNVLLNKLATLFFCCRGHGSDPSPGN